MSITYSIDSVSRDYQDQKDPLNYVLMSSQVQTWIKNPKMITAVPPDGRKNPLDFASTVNITGVWTPYPKPELFGTLIYSQSIDAGSNIIFNSIEGLVDGDIVWTSSSTGAPYGIPSDTPLYVVNAGASQFQISTSFGGPAIPLTEVTSLIVRFVIYNAQTKALYEDSKIILTAPFLYLILRCNLIKDSYNVRCIRGEHADVTHIIQRGGVTPDEYGAPGMIEWYSKSEQTQRWALDQTIEIGFETRSGRRVDVFKEEDGTLNKDPNPQRQSIINFIVTPFVRDGTYSNHFLSPQTD